jgi:prepilin-type N-terminal cleavage/methylation domain-containing protein
MFSISMTHRGFSLIELVIVVGLIGTMAAIGMPMIQGAMASIRLNEATRTVERELQKARLRAVSSNRALRVRLNCPSAGSIRVVEVLGTVVDTAANRCSSTAYPFPAADIDVMTRPNFDGPVALLPVGATVTSANIQFQPDGAANQVVSNVVQPITTPVTVTVTREGKSRTVTINAAGKIQLQ